MRLNIAAFGEKIKFLGPILFAGLGFIFLPHLARAATLSLSPVTATATVGSTFNVNIMVNTQGAATYGVDVYSLHFNPAVLQVVDANAAASGTQITAGSLMASTAYNFTNNSTGVIQFSQTPSLGSGNFTGSGVLATVTFQAIAAGSSVSTFDFSAGSTNKCVVAGLYSNLLTSVSGGSFAAVAASASAPSITSFTASPSGINSGSSAVLSWTVSGNPAPTLTLDNGIGSVTSLSSQTVSPSQTTTYNLTATNASGTATSAVTVTVTVTPVASGGGGGGGGSSGGGGGGGGGGPVINPVTPVSPVTPLITPSPITPTTGTSSPASAESLIDDNGTFYLLINNVLHGITNPGMLTTYGFTFAMAQPATTAELAVAQGSILTPQDGSLVKSVQDPTVYLISGQQRYGFVSGAVFLALGFKYSSVLVVTNPELQELPLASNVSIGSVQHLAGLDINRGGTIYWVGTDGQLHGYPSLAVYNTWHIPNDFSRVVPANAADNALPVGSLVSARVLD